MVFRGVVLSLLIVSTSVGAPNKQAITAHDAQQSEADQRGTQASPLIVKVEGDKSPQQVAAQNKKRDDLDTADKSHMFWLTVAIAFAGFCQAFIAGVQAFIYYRQAGLMSEGLKLSAKSVDSLMSSERAWLLINPEHWDNQGELQGPFQNTTGARFSLAIKNVGKTPAHLVASSFKYVLLDDLAELSPTPQYPSASDEGGRILMPNDSYSQMVELEGWAPEDLGPLITDIQQRKKVLFAYGYIQYRDNFQRMHECRVGLVYDLLYLTGRVTPQMRKKRGGPPSYNRAT